jgi:ubiquinone/menaquinone biosynthesis C-methylase UbiE
MGLYSAWVFPWVLDIVMRQKQLKPSRERVAKAASGRVLEVGIGSGLNLPFYGPQVHEVYGLDPSPELLRFAEKRGSKVCAPIKLFGGSSEALPLDDASVDTVAMTFTLCSIDNTRKALAEIRRVLKPSGRFLFAEHGRAPEPGVARWQDRFTPFWRRVAGGCHLNRKPDDPIYSAGFRIDRLDTGYLRGPKVMCFLYEGAATLR